MPNRHWHFSEQSKAQKIRSLHTDTEMYHDAKVPHDRVHENNRYSMTSQSTFPYCVKVSLVEERLRSGIGMDTRRRLSKPSLSHTGISCLCASVFWVVVATEVVKTDDVADKRVTVVDMLCGRSDESTGQNVGFTVCRELDSVIVVESVTVVVTGP